MLKKQIFIVLILSALAFGNAHADNYLYVVNSMAQTLSKINLDEGSVENHISTLQLVPNDIKVHGDSAYILHSLSDNIMIYDLINEQTVGSVEFLRGGNP